MAILRMRQGQAAAAARALSLVRSEGPQPLQATKEAISAAAALARDGWPEARDPATEAAIEEVRRRWVRIENRARQTSTR